MASITALDRYLVRLEKGLAPPDHDGRATSMPTSAWSPRSALEVPLTGGFILARPESAEALDGDPF